jgi:DnaJ-class molecular chaperone
MSEPHDPERCTPCRGTGRVISGLGGEPKPVTCPWCEGDGRRIAGHDAQAARKNDA